MKRTHLTLSDGGWPIVVMAVVNMLLVLCIIFMLRNHISPYFGMNVKMASSSFVMGSLNRDDTRVLTIAAGDSPRFYFGAKYVAKHWDGLESELKAFAQESHNQITIVIVADESVTVGTLQRTVDLILALGYNCTVAARPPVH